MLKGAAQVAGRGAQAYGAARFARGSRFSVVIDERSMGRPPGVSGSKRGRRGEK
jgi:hypothetical protein